MSDAERVMEVKEFPTCKDYPDIGDSNVLYLELATGMVHRWMGVKYSAVIMVNDPSVKTSLCDYYKRRVTTLEREVANMKKNETDAHAALGIIAAANRRVGYSAMILAVMWLNGFRYIESKWEMFFSLFGYTVYLSLIRTVDWFSSVFTGFFSALIELMHRSGPPL